MATKIYANARFGFREDTLENWTANNPVLEKGEPAVVRDGENGEWLKIGDGVTAFSKLPWKKGPQGIQGIKGPQGEKGEKGDKGENGDNGKDGKDAVTDQNYNPLSENAQSGIAVAEALNTVKTTETWREILNLTIEQEAVVSITNDSAGEALKLKKFKVVAELPATTVSRTVWLKLNKILAIAPTASSATAVGPSFGIDAEYTFDWQFKTCTHNTNDNSNAQLYSTPYGHRYNPSKISYPCNSIVLALNSACTEGFPIGTVIKIWGVDA